MKILVTGSKGFVGQNLVWNLEEIRSGRNVTRPELNITKIYSYDIGDDTGRLEEACQKADFVFHLAGVNRPKDQSEFMSGNYGFTSTLLNMLKSFHNNCPVMFSSSVRHVLADGLRIQSMAGANWRERNCFSNMHRKQVRKC